MLSGRVARVVVYVSVAICVAGLGGPILAADPRPESSSEVVAIRGRVVCLDALAAGTVAPESDPCNQSGARFELRAAGGETLHFVDGDPCADIFIDPQVRELDLEVRGWRRPGPSIEILSVYAVRDGIPHHLHYRCDVCNITTYAPGPCWCRGRPFELREGPAGEDGPSEPSDP